MAKRRTLNRLSKRYSRHRFTDSVSGDLDPDTSDINEGQTFWWNNLEDDTSPLHSFMRNSRNETARQLSLNSQLDSTHSSKEWWKHLRSSDDKHNASTSSGQNFSAAIVKTNVLETSTSESEKGLNLKKRKIPLRTTRRRSNSNNFLNVLDSNTDVTIPLKWEMKQAEYSALHDNPDRDISQRELHKNEKDSLNLSSTVNILKLKPSIFKKRKIGDMEEQNAFQDILTQDDILDDNARMAEKDSSMQEDIENNPRKAKKMSQILPLENNEPGPSNLSIPNAANAMSENNTTSDTMVQSSDESYVKMYSHKVLKHKSHFLQHLRKSIGNNVFEDALTDNRDTSLLRHNQSKEINPRDTKSSTKSSLDTSTRSVNRSKIDIRKSIITSSPLRRSPRASVNASKKQSQIDVPVQQHRDDIEGSLWKEGDDSSDDANEKQNPGMLSKLSPVKETRLTRNSLRNQLEISTNKGARKVRSDDDSSDDANEKEDLGVLSKLSPTKETHLIRNSLRNRSETSKLSKDIELSKQSPDRDNDEDSDEISVGIETDIGDFSQIISSTGILNIKASENATADKNVIPSIETETVDDENLVLATQIIQQNSSKNKTNIETVNLRPSLILQNLDRTHIKENRETSRQKSSSGFQNRYSTSIKTLSKDISKINLSKTPRTIDDFFKIKRSMTDKQSTSNDRNLAPSQVLNAEKIEKSKTELEKIKNREMAAMRMDGVTGKKDFVLKSVDTALKQATKKKKLLANPTKVVDKAYLVNGKVYKAPKLPRPKHWATDHLYKFLWKCMEPKYKLATRVQSEKFVHELAQVVSLIQRRKKYESYKDELKALMQEMARLKIIKTRNDFYNFCHDFLPYEFRVKVVPMLLPGNKKTISYDPEKLHLPLLDTLHSD